MVDSILPITAQLLEDDKLEVRQAACSTLVSISQLIKHNELGQHVLTVVLRLAHDDDKEEWRMTASELLNLLADYFGPDLCKQFVIPEVVSLAEDPVFRVRKSTALNFQNICKVGGEHELFERLMPAYVRLSKDDMYRVRRACAESLTEVSKHVSDDIRIGVLVEIFLRLAQDPSRLVKQSVLQQAGMFISTLPSKAITDVILNHYCSMAAGPTGDMSVDTELRYWCAYSFPGVLQTIGAERWEELREVYHSLVQSRTNTVKQTLALSLHEVARILGEQLVETELVTVFEEMIQDVEAVQIGVIKHLAEFLRLLPEPCRVSYLPLLHDILNSTNPFNWRLRQSLAVQLPDLVMLPPPHLLYNTLFILVMTLLQDPVASVRVETFKGVGTLIKTLNSLPSTDVSGTNPNFRSSDEFVDAVAGAINELVRGDTYQQRQLWLELARQLLCDLPRSIFERYFIHGILVLTVDPISNVRVNVADLLAGWAPDYKCPIENGENGDNNPWVWLFDRADIKECVKRLSKDDQDVYMKMKTLQPMFNHIEFESISCKGLKEAPGGSTPIEIDGGGVMAQQNQTVFMNGAMSEDVSVDAVTSQNTESTSLGKTHSNPDDSVEIDQLSITVNKIEIDTADNNSHIQEAVVEKSLEIEEKHDSQNPTEVGAVETIGSIENEEREDDGRFDDGDVREAPPNIIDDINANETMNDENIEKNETYREDEIDSTSNKSAPDNLNLSPSLSQETQPINNHDVEIENEACTE